MKVIQRPARAGSGTPTRVETARAARLEGWTRSLSQPRHIEMQSAENVRIGRGLAAFFQDRGYQVEIQGPYRNLVALPRDRENLTLVGAHYDSVPETAGADDNASGVAVMLEVATELAARGRPANVGFVAFNAEEDGFLGSTDFVARGIETLGLGVTGIHVLEMVGYATHAPGSQRLPTGLPVTAPDTGDFLGLLANGRSRHLLERTLERSEATPGLGVVGLKTFFGLERFFPILNLSDHVPFWKAGIPAMMWTDTSFLRNPNYHGPSDTPATLDYTFMARIAELVTSSVTP